MNFLEALEIIHKDRMKMMRPVGYGDAIYFDPIHGWMWNSGRKAGLPTPALALGEWEITDRLGEKHERDAASTTVSAF